MQLGHFNEIQLFRVHKPASLSANFPCYFVQYPTNACSLYTITFCSFYPKLFSVSSFLQSCIRVSFNRRGEPISNTSDRPIRRSFSLIYMFIKSSKPLLDENP